MLDTRGLCKRQYGWVFNRMSAVADVAEGLTGFSATLKALK